jgi:LysM repeat protein
MPSHRTRTDPLLRSRFTIATLAAFALVGGPILATGARAADEIVVRPGETLTSISRQHGVSIERLVELNEIANPSRIYAGQRLRLEEEAAAAPSAPSAPAYPAATRTHTVRSGEHLTGIARHYGVTIAQVVAANGIADASRIYAGQRLTIPGAGAAAPAAPAAPSAPAAPAATRTHTVRSGEHLTGIARHYGVTIAQVVAANGIADASRIYAGQRLTIPGAVAAPSTAPASGRAMPATMAELVARRGAVRAVIVEEAHRFGVPPAFALAVAWQESGWQQGVVSSAGAIGVMQLLPTTAQWVGDAMLGTPVNPWDLRHNVRAGVRLLAHYMDRYGGDRGNVLAAYYQGQAAVDRHGIYAVSRPYIASIAVLEALFAD